MYDRAVQSSVRLRRSLGVVALAVAGLLVAGACGSSQYRYVADSDTNTYLKVPKDWTAFDQDDVTNAQVAVGGMGPLGPLDQASMLDEKLIDEGLLRRQVEWRMAFDADPRASLQHVVLPGNQSPVIDVLVRDITDPPELRESMSLATLQRIFELQIAIVQGNTEGEPQLTSTPTIREIRFDDGLRGTRIQAAFPGPDGDTYTLDQTALIDGPTERIYVLSIRAREKEYLANYGVLDEIAKSFTVKQNG